MDIKKPKRSKLRVILPNFVILPAHVSRGALYGLRR